MIRKIVVSSILVMVATLNTPAETSYFGMNSRGKGWGSGETTLDVFGSLRVPEDKDFFDGRLGVGVGGNYFFNSFLGIGADTSVEKFDWPNHLNLSAIGRYPLDQWNLAPYLFTGFGREFHDTPQWLYHIGAGVDYRFSRKTGVFLDVRRTFAQESRDSTMWRLGLRYRF